MPVTIGHDWGASSDRSGTWAVLRLRDATKRRRYGEALVVEHRSAPPVEEYDPVGPIRYGPPSRILSVR
jgi:hypothetical protein